MDVALTRRFVEETWAESILPTLQEYITIPNQSPGFDPEWQQHGHMDAAVELIASWIRRQGIADLNLEVVQIAGRTPLLCVEVPGDASETVLLYGHLDKQPPMEGWHDGLGPWTPVIRDGRLYGRGAADDGYAAFAAITAINALRQQGLPHARCIVLIEACEESGSGDLPAYIDLLKDRFGRPSLVICLDSGCGNYEQLWMTSSLRGLLNGTLTVQTLTEAVHSGAASGIVPSTFRILRRLLSRVEDERTGVIVPRELYVEIPSERVRQATETAAALSDDARDAFPFHGATQPVSDDVTELLLNRTWRPQLEVTGAAGLPPLERAGNVLRPMTALKLSVRLPPTLDAPRAAEHLKRLLEDDPPYGATVTFDCHEYAAGWNAPSLAPWLEHAVQQASEEFFGKPSRAMGEGGTIPFMAMLGARFPQAQFLITGVLGPHSNAHGPNEFLDLATAQRLTACVARVLFEHHRATRGK
jgi:acetylornithine deacetylase/succinyl-diaminopimelate desuccinylase-like protein